MDLQKEYQTQKNTKQNTLLEFKTALSSMAHKTPLPHEKHHTPGTYRAQKQNTITPPWTATIHTTTQEPDSTYNKEETTH